MNIKEVANKAGVSITTVSRVLNDPDKVSEKTRNKIMSVMQELNYTPNWFARNLQKKRTNVIGILVPDATDQSNMGIVKGIEKVCRQKNCNIMLSITEYSRTLEEQQIEQLISRQIDGIILLSSSLNSEQIKNLRSREVSVVLIDRMDCVNKENVIYTDYEEASEAAVNHFIEMGRKHIAFVSSEKPVHIVKSKYEGYKKALNKEGLKTESKYIIETENSIEGGIIAISKLLELKTRPDAVFVADDVIAFGIIEKLREDGVSPDEVGVIGFNDLEVGSVIEPKLTTVTKPVYRMGLTAARLLFDMIEDENLGEENQAIMLQSRLKIRKSCGNKERLKEIW